MMELDYREIGRNISHCRREKGVKQRELAERTHVSEQHISHIETAKTQLSLPTLVAICNALEVDCNTILGSTLKGCRDEQLRQELDHLVGSMAADGRKLELCIELLRTIRQCEI